MFSAFQTFGRLGAGAALPSTPPAPSAGELTADDGTTLLYADDGATVLTED